MTERLQAPKPAPWPIPPIRVFLSAPADMLAGVGYGGRWAARHALRHSAHLHTGAKNADFHAWPAPKLLGGPPVPRHGMELAGAWGTMRAVLRVSLGKCRGCVPHGAPHGGGRGYRPPLARVNGTAAAVWQIAGAQGAGWSVFGWYARARLSI